MKRTHQSWGAYPRVHQSVFPIRSRTAALPRFIGSALPYGNGCSYGDSCLNPDNSLLDARSLDRLIEFDPVSGILRCEAGITLREILALTVPRGWFLPVTPGTSRVTVGGAIANDVHGKNHHRAGAFGNHVTRFEILRSDGGRMECQRGNSLGWFEATVGGLGLTGLITWAELQLKRIAGPRLRSETIRFGGIDEFYALSHESTQSHEYTVAWVDCLAKGPSLGRGHFIRANHLDEESTSRRRQPLAMPFTPPFSLVNRFSLRLFNALYYHRQRARTHVSDVHYDSFFYPLDAIQNWNRMYGSRGFLQHQCVLPASTSRDGIRDLLRTISASGIGSFLAVLKEFGNRPPVGMLSFPRHGTTLALDFPNDGPNVFALLDRLDRIVTDAGGAIYPAKDARMAEDTFKKGFPQWAAFQAFVDPKFSSGLWRRVTGVQ